MAKYERPDWDDYFLQIIDTVAKRGTCDRGRSGCVIIKDNQILTSGYVGSPPGLDHCDDVGHLMKKMIHLDGTISQHCVRTIHAEQNAMCQAARHGVSIAGATLYCKMVPCRTCAMLLISAGIKRVVCQKDYHKGEETKAMFEQVGVELKIADPTIEEYQNQ